MAKYIILGDDGGAGGAVTAHDVAYETTSDPSISNVWDALDKLLYKGQSMSLSGGGTYEIGTVVHGVHLTWTYSKAIVSQSLDNGIGALDLALRAYDWPDDISTSTAFTLTSSDGQQTSHATTSVVFQRKAYWGASALTSLANADILALSSNAFATSLARAVAYDCTGKKYPYYCYPASFGPLTDVRVGGLAFSDFTQTIVSLTNASGHTEDYYVTRFNGIQTGSNIQVSWS